MVPDLTVPARFCFVEALNVCGDVNVGPVKVCVFVREAGLLVACVEQIFQVLVVGRVLVCVSVA